MGRLEGKTVVVTGGGRGLGRAFAEHILREGGRVAIAEIDGEMGEKTAQELRAAGNDVFAHQTDISSAASLESLAAAVRERWGGLDGLVNNAAIASGIGGKRFDEIDETTFERVINVNIKGTWLAIRHLVPLMRERGKGKIVNLASDTALWGAPVLLHYVASKGAIIAMTRSLARELGEYNIAINSIAPGLTLTEATSTVAPGRHKLYVEGRAIQRQQFPEDVTGAAVFLLSDDADFITGQLLAVNGGFVFN
ncbi:MAG: SDR family oxidoreductase [Chloroflexi bacterium]|nr:SDR family oxidoreductase [Chloroflexota bacterium]OJW00734.1 MAG: short-chain dehydrogenase [Chloroflexi bacterium 54-19]